MAASLTLHGGEKTLFDFEPGFEVDNVQTRNAKAFLTTRGEGAALRVETGHEERWPGITLEAPEGRWDLTLYEYAAADIRNPGDRPVSVFCRVDDPRSDGRDHCVTEQITVEPGGEGILIARLYPTQIQLDEPLELIGMRAAPSPFDRLDHAHIARLLFFVTEPKTDYVFEIDNVRAGGAMTILKSDEFIPFIDRFGQFKHKDWPGKTRSAEQMKTGAGEERKDLAAHPSPPDWNRFGGWTAGPQLEATGFFRVQKHDGKWWLVDPEGRLFWSHGMDCVHDSVVTPISDREHYFEALPDEGDPAARFYGRGDWAPHGYYTEHSPYKTYDLFKPNLRLKYGENWKEAFVEITHRRLRSWGMNTIANWSDAGIYGMRRTPYTVNIALNAGKLEGSEGYWGKFYDVFDPGFRASLRRRMAEENTVKDPWLIGYFVHNELGWGDEVSLAEATLASPPGQAAKQVFVDDLKAKYEGVERLNEKWGTDHSSWESLLTCVEKPDRKKAWDDLAAFYTKTAETYFKTIREELKRAAPNHLYLGCRFAWVNNRAARAAAKHCDVVCYNRYSYSVENHRLPDEIDAPVIVGEFHFGALDRGLFHTGLKKTLNQQARAGAYLNYVQGALRNPYIVGTHWFQYKDQATTGRGDGENYQIGFIDICDRPYPETIQACRQAGYSMYAYRLNQE